MSLSKLIPCMLIVLSGCSSMNTARPLPPKAHAAGLTFGGPLVEFGGSYIPLPNAILEGRSGLEPLNGHAWDVSYGINLTAIAFDQIGLQGGTTYLIMEQDGARPAWSVSDKLFLYNNWLSSSRHPDSKGIWAMNQIETLVSWQYKGQLLYAGVSQSIDLQDPSLLINPILGVELINSGTDPGFSVQLETRYYAIGRHQQVTAATWKAPAGTGALGMSLGLQYRFGGNNK